MIQIVIFFFKNVKENEMKMIMILIVFYFLRVLFGDDLGKKMEKKIRCLWFITSYNRSLIDPTVFILKKIKWLKIKDLIRPMVDHL